MRPRIGIDLDNTIACYDEVFWRIARERDAIPPDTDQRKSAVRGQLVASGREQEWTLLQAEAYGPQMSLAKPFDGAPEALTVLAGRAEVFIVSHRSRRPYLGPPYDLHAAARAWLTARGLVGPSAPIPADHVHLEVDRRAKLQRIRALGCTHFIDDQLELLTAADFPARTSSIHFDSGGLQADGATQRFADWRADFAILLGMLGCSPR